MNATVNPNFTDHKGNSVVSYRIAPDGQLVVQPSFLPNLVFCTITSPIDLNCFLDLYHRTKLRDVQKFYITYLYGGRSDKETSSCIVSFLNGLPLPEYRPQIRILDPHPRYLMKISYYSYDYVSYIVHLLDKGVFLILPDESAADRLENSLRYFGLDDSFELFTIIPKERLDSGEVKQDLSSLAEIEFLSEDSDSKKQVLIFDDIFDGGASCLNIVKALPENVDITIACTHFIGSNADNLAFLLERGCNFVITDSYPTSVDTSGERFKVFQSRKPW